MSNPLPICGPSYEYLDKFAAVERLVNWYLNVNESPDEKKFQFALAECPGNAPFGQLPVPTPFNQPNRGLIFAPNEGLYGVNGDVVFSMDHLGAYTNIGTIAGGSGISSPVSMSINGQGQIFIAEFATGFGLGYVIPPGGGAGSLISLAANPDFLGATYGTFQDGYTIVINGGIGTQQFQISGNPGTPLGDSTIWDAANISIQAGQNDSQQAIISTREYLYLIGSRRSQIYYNAG